jgi:hypothetical protein
MKVGIPPTGCSWRPAVNPIDPETGKRRSRLTL